MSEHDKERPPATGPSPDPEAGSRPEATPDTAPGRVDGGALSQGQGGRSWPEQGSAGAGQAGTGAAAGHHVPPGAGYAGADRPGPAGVAPAGTYQTVPIPDRPNPWSAAAGVPYPGSAGRGPAHPGAGGEPGYGGYPGPAHHPGHGFGGYPPPPDQPVARAGGDPSPSRAGRTVLAGLVLLALMVISAVGGGILGATIYSQVAPSGGDGGGGTTVVDGPRLDYTSLASIASEVSPSVVSIRVGDFGGSGVVMSEDGHIITNAHVVEVARGNQVAVRFSDGNVAQATIIGMDRRSDIAVVRAEGVPDLTPATFGDSGEILVGDTVLAIGSPLGFDGSVTQGIVSALDRTVRPDDREAITLSGLIQTDAAINRGNSGGALVNLSGEVIGINTLIAVENQDDGFLGVGFAVSSNRAMDVAERLIAGEEISHAFLGVSAGPAEGGGAVIGEVVPGSPAERAGLRPGDVVVRMGDRQITDASDLVSAVQSASAGDVVEVEFRRDGVTQTTSVTLAEAD